MLLSLSLVEADLLPLASRYWTFPQMVAHHTLGGCNLRPGGQAGARSCPLHITAPPLSKRHFKCRQSLPLAWRAAYLLVLLRKDMIAGGKSLHCGGALSHAHVLACTGPPACWRGSLWGVLALHACCTWAGAQAVGQLLHAPHGQERTHPCLPAHLPLPAIASSAQLNRPNQPTQRDFSSVGALLADNDLMPCQCA